jgi:hypothetical protein
MKPVTPKVLANNIFFQIWYVVFDQDANNSQRRGKTKLIKNEILNQHGLQRKSRVDHRLPFESVRFSCSTNNN